MGYVFPYGKILNTWSLHGRKHPVRENNQP